MTLEIRPETEAQDGQIVLVHNGAELVDLLRGHKLAFIHDDDLAVPVVLLVNLQNVRLGRDHRGRGSQSDAAAEHRLSVPGVGAGL